MAEVALLLEESEGEERTLVDFIGNKLVLTPETWKPLENHTGAAVAKVQVAIPIVEG